MDFGNIGVSGGSGFLAGVLTVLGLNRNKVDKDTCERTHNQVNITFDTIRSDLKYIRDRVDKLYDFAVNGKGKL
jgi:hypothetical protein